MSASGETMPRQERALDRWLEQPAFYALTQKLNPFTVGRLRTLAERHVAEPLGTGRLIDIGCGVGAYFPIYAKLDYTGVDINPHYIDVASRMHQGTFRVMDAGRLDFSDGSFDSAVSMAMTHHLDDDTMRSMVAESFRILKRPKGRFHIIDAILPLAPAAWFKRWIFMSDRGRHQRTLRQMSELLGSVAQIACVEVLPGPVHDVAYFGLEPLSGDR